MSVLNHSHTLRPKKVSTHQKDGEVVVSIHWACIWLDCDHYRKTTEHLPAPGIRS